MTVYAVEAEVYVEAPSAIEAEAYALTVMGPVRRRRGVVRVAVGLSREAEPEETEDDL